MRGHLQIECPLFIALTTQHAGPIFKKSSAYLRPQYSLEGGSVISQDGFLRPTP